MMKDLKALRRFVVRHWFWMLLLLGVNALVWAILDVQAFRGLNDGDRWAVRMYLLSGLLLFDNLCVLWWYADSTRRQAEASKEQAEASRQQAGATEELLRQNRVARWQEYKPIVFMEFDKSEAVFSDEDEGPVLLPTYVIRNVGSGPALNVFLLLDVSRPSAPAIPLGALGAHEERPVSDGHAGFRYVLIAEGLATRTRRWNATLNLGSSRSGRVVHQLVDLGAPKMGDDQHHSLEEFLQQNRKRMTEQLHAMKEPEQGKGEQIQV